MRASQIFFVTQNSMSRQNLHFHPNYILLAYLSHFNHINIQDNKQYISITQIMLVNTILTLIEASQFKDEQLNSDSLTKQSMKLYRKYRNEIRQLIGNFTQLLSMIFLFKLYSFIHGIPKLLFVNNFSSIINSFVLKLSKNFN